MSTKWHPLLWMLALILLTIVACTTQEPAPADSELASGETPSPASGNVVAVTVPAVEALPSPSSTPAPPPATPTRSDVSTSNPPAAPAGLEPTATPTPAPPAPALTPTPIPTSSVVPGWLTYENEFLGYSFSYPSEATIGHHGTTEEPPENITTRREYLAWEETVTPNNLCVGVGYKTGFVTVGPADDPLALYASPCGITGIGDYTIENWEEVVLIGDQPYTAGGHRLYIWETDQLEQEFYILLDVNDNLRIDFGFHWRSTTPKSGQHELTEAEFNEIRETLLQILASFRF